MIYLYVVVALLAVDQISKYMVVKYMALGAKKTLIPGLIDFHYIQNNGAAFSILDGKRFFLIGISTLLVVFLWYLLYRSVQKNFDLAVRISYAVILAGGLGNLIDRIRLGYVIDFIEFSFVRFPVFNLADVMVVLGAATLIGLNMFGKREI